jgi:SAM-dependent methyltransferase
MISPLSGSEDCKLIRTISATNLSLRWRQELGVTWEPPKGLTHINYWRDLKTGLLFYTPSEAAGGPYLYQQLQKFSWYYMAKKWEFLKAIEILHRFRGNAQPCFQILEVGVGNGYFLELARDSGLGVTGVELNPDAVALNREKGFRILENNLSTIAASSSERWDAICSFQVLEHLTHPDSFLEEMIRLLKPTGILILSVPNSAISAGLDPARTDLLDQPPHHMSHWDESVFRSLEGLFPLRVREVAFEPLATYHIDWFADSWRRRLQKRLGFFPGRLIMNPLLMAGIRLFLSLGFRHFFRGHTLLVSLQKTG